MAVSQQMEQPKLRFLGLFEVFVDKATKLITNAYEFAKERAGPLKPGMYGVEITVRTVVNPLYQRIEGKPHAILLFVDRKVGETVEVLQGYVPQKLKETSYKAYVIARQVPDVALCVVSDVHNSGIVETTKLYFERYEPVAEEWSYAAWKRFLKLPYAPQAVQLVAPPALFCASTFNQLVDALKGRQVPLSGYIPSLAVEKLEKAVKRDVAEAIQLPEQ